MVTSIVLLVKEGSMKKKHARTEKEIVEVYERHYLMLYRICFTYMKNPADTEDMVQETFMQLMNKGPKFENEEHEKAWLIRVATNLCKNKVKHWWSKNLSFGKKHEQMNANDRMIDETLQVILELPDKYKTVIYLFYYEEYTSVEISKMLGIPASTIRNHLHEARNILKDQLGGDYIHET